MRSGNYLRMRWPHQWRSIKFGRHRGSSMSPPNYAKKITAPNARSPAPNWRTWLQIATDKNQRAVAMLPILWFYFPRASVPNTLNPLHGNHLAKCFASHIFLFFFDSKIDMIRGTYYARQTKWRKKHIQRTSERTHTLDILSWSEHAACKGGMRTEKSARRRLFAKKCSHNKCVK